MKHLLYLWCESVLNTKESIYFLHIGKTGGTSLLASGLFGKISNPFVAEIWKKQRALRLRHRIFFRNNLVYVNHDQSPEYFNSQEKKWFIVREPYNRFKSAFYFEKNIKNTIWSKTELSQDVKNAYKRFDTFESWLSAYSNPNHSEYKHALRIRNESYHMKRDYEFYFKDDENVRRQKNSIIFIGELESLSKDLQSFGGKIGIPHLDSFLAVTNKSERPSQVTDDTQSRSLFARNFVKEHSIYQALLELKSEIS